MVSLTIKLEPELKAEIEVEARLTGRSVSDLVREILRKRKRHPRHEPSLYDRVKDLCGTVESGKADLATNRKHLEGFGSASAHSSAGAIRSRVTTPQRLGSGN